MSLSTVNVRASGLAELFDCPARWYARNIEGKNSWRSGRAKLGDALHAGTGLFDQAGVEGTPVRIDDACDAFTDELKNTDEGEVRWQDITMEAANDIGVTLTEVYCRTLAPTIRYEAVEVECHPLSIDMGIGVTIRLTGTVDRVRLEGDSRGVSDLKSGARLIKNGKVDTDKHTVQLAVYELLEILAKQTTGHAMTLPAQVIALPTSGVLEPQADLVHRPSKLLLGDANHQGLLDIAARMFKSGAFYGNTKSMLCSGKFCPAYDTCWWRAKE